MFTLDPKDSRSESAFRHKQQELAKFIKLTDNQQTIIDLYLLEESTGKRHWEIYQDDKHIYLEWLYGTNILRNMVNKVRNMSKQQKAMNNNSNMVNQNSNGNNTQQFKQKQQGPYSTLANKNTITTNSGKSIDPKERPDLLRTASKPKRYPRRSRG